MESQHIRKDPDAWKDCGQEEKGARVWDGWMASLTQWTWLWANLGDSEGQRSLVFSVDEVADSRTWLSDRTTTRIEKKLICNPECIENQWQWKQSCSSCVWLFVTPWTVAHQAPPSMGFSRQDYWSELPFPSPGDLPDPGIEPRSSTLQADTLTSEPPGKP